jgi:hypothetical protein
MVTKNLDVGFREEGRWCGRKSVGGTSANQTAVGFYKLELDRVRARKLAFP